MARTRDELEAMTVDELQDVAAEEELSGRSKMSKADLVAALADGDGTGEDARGETRLEVMQRAGERAEVKRAREGLPSERVATVDDADDGRPRLESGRPVPGISEAMEETRGESPEPRRFADPADEPASAGVALGSGRPVPGLDPRLAEVRDADREAMASARPRSLTEGTERTARGS